MADEMRQRHVGLTGNLLQIWETMRVNSNYPMRQFCEPHFSGRPGWPKQLYIVGDIPLTDIGKIFKPALRCNAAKRVVMALISGLVPPDLVAVDVVAGGKRGMEVSIAVMDADQGLITALIRTLDGHLLDLQIKKLSARTEQLGP